MGKPNDVLRLSDLESAALVSLLQTRGLHLVFVAAGAPIPGSFWGDEEAGMIGSRLYARPDTPVHSILHEAAHYACMTPQRRQSLDTNAGGDYDEENAVCYLQVLWADELAEVGRDRMFADMDAWGYTFRLGSTRAWFNHDAGDACESLRRWGLIDTAGRPTQDLRGAPPPEQRHTESVYSVTP